MLVIPGRALMIGPSSPAVRPVLYCPVVQVADLDMTVVCALARRLGTGPLTTLVTSVRSVE